MGYGNELGMSCTLLNLSVDVGHNERSEPMYIQSFVCVIHASTNDFSIVDEDAANGGLVGIESGLSLAKSIYVHSSCIEQSRVESQRTDHDDSLSHKGLVVFH
jgi:hypothetical protein